MILAKVSKLVLLVFVILICAIIVAVFTFPRIKAKRRRFCEIYLRANTFFVAFLHETECGIRRTGEPYEKIDEQASAHELGQKVLSVLHSPAVSDAKVPDDWDSVQSVWEFAGIRSWSSFAKGVKYMVVSSDG